MEKYDITDYLKDDKELQKAVIEEFLKENADLRAENEKLKEEVRTEKIYSSQVEELEESIVGQRNAYKKLNSLYIENCEYTKKLEETLQEIKGVATALYMNNWLQMNETARKSIQLLQELITKAEEE